MLYPLLQANTTNTLGERFYSMSNHLSNVLTVINDIKTPQSEDGNTVSGYQAGIVNISDYSPFGVELDGRTIKSDFYRRSFQGQESDPEIKGEGNSVNYKYRMHDPRVGRFAAVDPLTAKYPWNSPYAFSENKVIAWRELEGLETYFSAGAGHDGSNTGYITKIKNSLQVYGDINHFRDVSAHGSQLFDARWSTETAWNKLPYNKIGFNERRIKETYYAPYSSTPVYTYENVWVQSKPNWRISSNIRKIKKDLKESPLPDDHQFNFGEYYTRLISNEILLVQLFYMFYPTLLL